MNTPKEGMMREIEAALADYPNHRNFEKLLELCEATCELFGGCAIVNYTADHNCVSVMPGAPDKRMGTVEPNAKYKRLFLFDWQTEEEVESFVAMLKKKFNL